MENKRTDVLQGLQQNAQNHYKILTDGTKIGKNVLDDLLKYMELELKNKYTVDPTTWIVEKSENVTDDMTNIEYLYDHPELNSKLLKLFNFDSTAPALGTKREFDRSTDIQDLKKYNISFYTRILLIKGSIKIIVRPNLIPNDDSKDKANIMIDKYELDKIFKKTSIGSLDDLVLLEFYNEFNKKYKKLKKYLVANDTDIKGDIIEDLYDKLFTLYDIKINNKKINIPDPKKGSDDKPLDKKPLTERDRVKDYVKTFIDKYKATMTGGAISDDVQLLNKLIKNLSDDNKYEKILRNLVSITDAKKITRKDKLYGIYTSFKDQLKIKKKYLLNKLNNDKSDDRSAQLKTNTKDLTLNHFLNDKYELYDLYSFIRKLKRENKQAGGGNTVSIGGASNATGTVRSMGDSKNDPKTQEKEMPTLLDHLNSLREVSVKIITLYYKLIEQSGAENADIAKLYKNDDDDEDGGIENENSTDAGVVAKDSKPLDATNKTDTQKKSEAIYAEITEGQKNKNKYDGKKKMLEDVLKEIIPLFVSLYKICMDIKSFPQVTEYEEHLKNILNKSNIKLFEKKEDKDKHNQHNIIKAIVAKITQNSKDISENDIALKSLEVQKKDSDRQRDRETDALAKQKIYPLTATERAAVKAEEDAKKAATTAAPAPATTAAPAAPATIVPAVTTVPALPKKQESFGGFDKLKDYLIDFVVELKENTEDVSADSGDKVKNGKDINIFDKIWNNYNVGMNRNDYKGSDKYKNQFNSLREGRKLYDSVIQNNLDPEIVLQINLQDKSIFIFLIFLIRTIIIIAIEFLIEYNMVKTLQFAIILYAFSYLVILCLFIIFVNYDSYKLRIIFNYLNLHINSSNMLLHIILFAVFTALVYIIIQSDNFLKNFGYMFDYTNIYNHIYDIKGIFTEDSDTHISRNEKLKLLYRTDIISMLVFIFTSSLILIM
jgi:hypothetical protein